MKKTFFCFVGCLMIAMFIVSMSGASPMGESDAMKGSPKKESQGSPEEVMKGSPANETVATSEDSPPMPPLTIPEKLGVAMMKGTQEGSQIEGLVSFAEYEDGLNIDIVLANVPGSGNHGIHIHENGSCDDGGKAAGGHFNPDGVDHGMLSKDGFENAHVGDMGNIEINEDGEGRASTVLAGVQLDNGPYAIVNKAVILHEKEDDFGQPTGNAGGRIGCGIITLMGGDKE